MTVHWIYHVLIIVVTFTYLSNYDYANADAISSCSCPKWWLFRLCWRILPIYLCCDHFIFFAFLSADLAELIMSIVFHFFHSAVSICFAIPWIWHSVKLSYFFAVFCIASSNNMRFKKKNDCLHHFIARDGSGSQAWT